MNPFTLFARPKLRPAWTFSPEAAVWRILFGNSGKIVGESRDQEKKIASFFCLDERTGVPFWQNRPGIEPWWVGIEAVHNDVVLLHGFEKPDMPGHQGIVAWDLEGGQELWRDEHLTFWFCYRDRIYAYRTLFEKRVGTVLALRSGEVLETYQDGIDALFEVRQLAQREERSDQLQFPEIFAGTREPSAVDRSVMEETRTKDIVGSVEVLSCDPYVVLNYHVPTPESTLESVRLENHLAVLHVQKNARLYADIVARDATAPVPDSFFLKDGILYFVKDQRTLVAMPLPGLTRDSL